MRPKGFTLIELMIVVAIIGILAAVAVPRFADLIRKSREGSGKANLGAMRSAISIYYGELEGQYPRDDLSSLIVDFKFFSELPSSKTPNYHADSNLVKAGADPASIYDDSAGWAYVNNESQSNWGQVWVNCTHTDTKGVYWTAF